jgi:hypothetical protein
MIRATEPWSLERARGERKNLNGFRTDEPQQTKLWDSLKALTRCDDRYLCCPTPASYSTCKREKVAPGEDTNIRCNRYRMDKMNSEAIIACTVGPVNYYVTESRPSTYACYSQITVEGPLGHVNNQDAPYLPPQSIGFPIR